MLLKDFQCLFLNGEQNTNTAANAVYVNGFGNEKRSQRINVDQSEVRIILRENVEPIRLTVRNLRVRLVSC